MVQHGALTVDLTLPLQYGATTENDTSFSTFGLDLYYGLFC